MDAGVLLIHFGEPPTPERTAVERYLERIFYQNADLESASSEEEARARSAELAERRAPSLIEEYEEIGGSPLNHQAEQQAENLERVLGARGHDTNVDVAFQFFEPTIPDGIDAMRDAGIEHLIALPVYPLCGPSTTVAALETVDETLAEMDWEPDVTQLSGWHRQPAYLRMRANHIQSYLHASDIDLDDPETVLLFSAHGTPISYIEGGSRYVTYVEETCDAIARLLGIETYELGYQNHENRDIPWTSPDVDEVVEHLDAERVVVEAMSFMHEQSETLAELDDDLATVARSAGLDFHRVPIPHDDDAFPELLADIVEAPLTGIEPALYQLRRCQCKPGENTYCLNAPPSPLE